MLNLLWIMMMAGGIFYSAFQGKMAEVTEVCVDSASEAVQLCIFMLGVIGVWNGMMEIAVQSGLMKKIAGWMEPLIHWLFPDIPRGHRASEYIAANMAANILGLGWAATPAGLKAMAELKGLDMDAGRRRVSGGSGEKEGVASDMMCAFLVLNISSLQLIPINMIAYRSQYGSVNAASIVLPSICSTFLSTLAGILFIKVMEKCRKRRRR